MPHARARVFFGVQLVPTAFRARMFWLQVAATSSSPTVQHSLFADRLNDDKVRGLSSHRRELGQRIGTGSVSQVKPTRSISKRSRGDAVAWPMSALRASSLCLTPVRNTRSSPLTTDSQDSSAISPSWPRSSQSAGSRSINLRSSANAASSPRRARLIRSLLLRT
jgi:hypothetical protein